jgi:isopentenyl-diphosphate delta-isomerase type 1
MPDADRTVRDRGAAELFDLVDEQGAVIGRASRAECHRDPRLIHRAVHVFVYNRRGELFLQQRSPDKDIQPGMWDTSVGGHVALGETPEAAMRREMAEELGLRGVEVHLLHHYLWRTPVETELVWTWRCTHEGPFALQREEIAAGQFFARQELPSLIERGLLTPNLVHELQRLEMLDRPS